MTVEPGPAPNQPAGVANAIGGGMQFGPVVQGRDVQATFQLPVAAPVALGQIPAATTGFTGRADELAVLAALLDPAGLAGSAVLAVAGLAGVGKTALAVQAGHAALGRGWFSGGVLFIDLHGFDDEPVAPAQALDALLRALGVPAEHIPPGAEQRAGLYRSVLAQVPKPVLVIADNASSEAQVRPLLPGGGLHKVLVTSRHTLAGLHARLLDLTILDEAVAVELLDGALQAARPGDARVSGYPEAAQRVAAACGGLPLALQIVAALLKADTELSAAELAEELSAEQDRLLRLAYDDGSGGGLSVAAAFELSYRRLDDATAQVFRLLPVSPGPDVSTAAAGVLAGLPVNEVRKMLGRLAWGHLAEATPGMAGRWRMHDLVRLYALQLSDTHAEADSREQARDRLLGYYLDMTAAAGKHLLALAGTVLAGEFADQDAALAWLDAERASLVAAVAMAARTGRDQAAIRLSLVLAGYLDWRRRFDDRLATTAISLDAARRLGDPHGEAMALNNLGIALQQVRRFEEAITACQDAVAIYRETGDRDGEGVALGNLGLALRQVRRFGEAITAHQQNLEICREAGDRHGEAMALNNLGLTLHEAGQGDEAVTACQDAVAIYRDMGDRAREATALRNLGLALRQVRRFGEAITAHQQDLEISRETGDRHGEGSALNNLSDALRQVRRFGEATTACQGAVAILRETGDRHGEAMALINLGIALHKGGQADKAVIACQDAVVVFRETGDRYHAAGALNDLGLALREVRRYGEAITACQDAVAIYREMGDRHGEATTLNILGIALHEGGQADKAVIACQDAAAIFRETGDRDNERIALENAAELQGPADSLRRGGDSGVGG